MSTECKSVLLITNEKAAAAKLQDLLALTRRQKFQLDWLTLEQFYAAPDLHSTDIVLVDITDPIDCAALLTRFQGETLPPVILLTHENNIASGDLPACVPAGAADILDWPEISAPLLERALCYAAEKKETSREQELRLQSLQNQMIELLRQVEQPRQADDENQSLVQELKKAQQVTERAALEARQAAREARASATRLEAIINSLKDAVFVYDHEGNVQLANSFAIAVLGFDPIRMPRTTLLRRIKITRRDGSSVTPEEMPFNRAENGELIFHDPITLTNSRGRSYDLLSSALPFYIGREFSGVVVVWTDVTRLERLQEEVRQKDKDLQVEQVAHQTKVEVQRQITRHREMERTQIARDLHDSVLQNMIAFNFALVEAMEMDSKVERLAKLRWLQESLTKEIRDLRSYCNDLRPPVLAPFGLEKAIRSHIEALKERHPNLNIQVEMMHDGKRLSEEVRMVLYRIYQELTANVIKHAQATTMRVELNLSDHLLTMTISDDGNGFEIPSNWVEAARHGHFGIIGARERMESIGGELEIQSKLTAGTDVTMRLPLNR